MADPEEVDFELISAFIDGRLSGTDRERAVRLLADSEEAFEVYSDALRTRADLKADVVVPISERRPWRSAVPWRAVGTVAAAAAVLIAVFPAVQARRDRAVMDVTSNELVRPFAGSPGARTLLASDARGWSVTRGGSGPLVDSTLAFRLGVRSVDLQVAVAQRDTLRADLILREIVETLDAIDLSEPFRAQYLAIRDSGAVRSSAADLSATVATAERGLDGFLQSSWFDFGRWIGAAELAARARSQEFFADARTERFLRVAAANDGLSAGDAELIRRIGVLGGQAVTDAEFETLREHFSTLIRRYGG